jgi:hypothetical protein
VNLEIPGAVGIRDEEDVNEGMIVPVPKLGRVVVVLPGRLCVPGVALDDIVVVAIRADVEWVFYGFDV